MYQPYISLSVTYPVVVLLVRPDYVFADREGRKTSPEGTNSSHRHKVRRARQYL